MTEERERLRQLKTQFDAAHQRGMHGLELHDYGELQTAIHEEREIIAEQKKVIDRVQERIASHKRISRYLRRKARAAANE